MTTYRIIAQQNADYDLLATWKNDAGTPIDLTGFTAELQVRATYPETTAALTLTDGAGITLGGAAGTIQIHITAAQTLALAAKTWVYDLRLVDGVGGEAYRVLEGSFLVTPAVTR